MVSELDCISTCVMGQGPVISGLNIFLIATIIVAAIILVFFHRRFAVKWNLLLKAVFLTAIFSLLIVLFFAQIGLKRRFDPKTEKILSEESANLGMKKPNLYVFEDFNRTAFVVSGLKKTVFLSTGLLSKLDSEEIRIVIVHELLHLKSGLFKTKRFFHAVRAGFFGLLPVKLEELDTIEEMRVDNKLLQKGLDIKRIKQKL